MSPWTLQKDLWLNGVLYASPAEKIMAEILTERGISFKYSVRYDTKRKDNISNFREVDFLLEEPIKVYWCPRPLTAIEVKGGYLTEKAWWQKRELRNAGVNTFIATLPIIEFWRNYAFLRGERLPRSSNEPIKLGLNEFYSRGINYETDIHKKMAQILYENKIEFEYGKKLLITDKRGQQTEIFIDFWLLKPVKIYWASRPTQIIDVEDILTPETWRKRKRLKQASYYSFIATKYILSFWNRCAFLRDDPVPDKRNLIKK